MQENKMGVMPIDKLIFSMSVPLMISMLVQACYNIIDSIFVAMINEDALTAVSMAFPIQNLMIAVGAGTAVGVNSLMARSLGEKDYDHVNTIADHGVFLAVLSYVVFLIVGFFFIDPFYRSQTDIESIITYGTEYLSVCCIFSFGVFIQLMFERMLQATGKTIYSMITQATGAIINIIMDPILIFGLFGFPKMGITGAAVATVIGQIVGGLVAIYCNQTKNVEVKLHLKGFRPSLRTIGQIYVIGVPSIIMQAIGSVMNYGMNRILISFSSTATAVFGVYFKLQSFIFMPVFGLNNGTIPVIAYNYGAGHRDRVINTRKHTVFYAVIIMALGTLVFQFCPTVLLQMFSASDTMIEIGIPALRIISISFILAGFNIATSGSFQGTGMAVYSMIISIARQLVVLLPVAYALALTGNVEMVWWAFPFSELFSFVLTLYFRWRLNRDIISKIGETKIGETA
jgi:putative MATE family efflux protein